MRHRVVAKMVKRKLPKHSKETKSVAADLSIPPVHYLTSDNVGDIRTKLLSWYNSNKRDLPWRKNGTISDLNQRAYTVWVSEVMLQQTQVATVIEYFNKWIKRWPTLESLSAATLEEVNEMWSGLGYYSRGRRLYEGAKKVVEEFNGEMPKDADGLLRELPGVGRYTAGAIASIALGQRTGLVDGNVVRVLCRLCMIGADSGSPAVTDILWSHANNLVDPESPGDFNQGLMELGATVCTPKAPMCSSCPLRECCKAHAQDEHQKQLNGEKLTSKQKSGSSIPDIECLADNCRLCLPDTEAYDRSLGVMNYPRKGKKKAAREERTAVYILCRESPSLQEYLLVQRPDTGLLAGLWEFPSMIETDGKVSLSDVLGNCGVTVKNGSKHIEVGEVVHLFSHIHQTYVVEGIITDPSTISQKGDQSNLRWLTKPELQQAALSTAMKKVFKAFEAAMSGKSKEKSLTKLKKKEDKSQPSISSFFKPKSG